MTDSIPDVIDPATDNSPDEIPVDDKEYRRWRAAQLAKPLPGLEQNGPMNIGDFDWQSALQELAGMPKRAFQTAATTLPSMAAGALGGINTEAENLGLGQPFYQEQQALERNVGSTAPPPATKPSESLADIAGGFAAAGPAFGAIPGAAMPAAFGALNYLEARGQGEGFIPSLAKGGAGAVGAAIPGSQAIEDLSPALRGLASAGGNYAVNAAAGVPWQQNAINSAFMGYAGATHAKAPEEVTNPLVESAKSDAALAESMGNKELASAISKQGDEIAAKAESPAPRKQSGPADSFPANGKDAFLKAAKELGVNPSGPEGEALLGKFQDFHTAGQMGGDFPVNLETPENSSFAREAYEAGQRDASSAKLQRSMAPQPRYNVSPPEPTASSPEPRRVSGPADSFPVNGKQQFLQVADSLGVNASGADGEALASQFAGFHTAGQMGGDFPANLVTQENSSFARGAYESGKRDAARVDLQRRIAPQPSYNLPAVEGGSAGTEAIKATAPPETPIVEPARAIPEASRRSLRTSVFILTKSAR